MQAIELQQNQKNGFVHFKSRLGSISTDRETSSASSSSHFKVPEHFRAKAAPVNKPKGSSMAGNRILQDASAAVAVPPPSAAQQAPPSGSAYATEADRLRAELQELRAKKEAAQSRRDSLANALVVATDGDSLATTSLHGSKKH
jgi:hypothetical protein